MKKQISSTYLVAKYLLDNKQGQICHMKRCCKANNIGQRVMQLRKSWKWDIDTVLLGYEKGVAVYEYKLIKSGMMPNENR